MDERKARTETTNGFKNLFGAQPNHPLAAIEQVEKLVQAKLDRSMQAIELKKQEVDLEILRVTGMVAAARQALPVIDRVIGDPNHTLAKLTDFALQRGCDVAEICTEIEFLPEK